jgi:hypothetical protein
VTCVRGASALQEVLADLPKKPLRIFVIWEPVIPTDFAPPSTAVLARIPDLRVAQYYDRSRLLSNLLVKKARETPGYLPGEQGIEEGTILWDCVLVFPPGDRWEESPPRPDFAGATVVEKIDEIRRRLQRGADNVAPGAISPGLSVGYVPPDLATRDAGPLESEATTISAPRC